MQSVSTHVPARSATSMHASTCRGTVSSTKLSRRCSLASTFNGSFQSEGTLAAQFSRQLNLCNRTSTTVCKALPEGEGEESEALLADLARYKSKQPSSLSQPQQVSSSNDAQPNGLKETIDKVLIADFFVVLAILAWLIAGVVQSSVNGGDAPLLNVWYSLWPMVWQPAIGVLMLGALVSGGMSWLGEQQAKR